jgi:hypothetical protein
VITPKEKKAVWKENLQWIQKEKNFARIWTTINIVTKEEESPGIGISQFVKNTNEGPKIAVNITNNNKRAVEFQYRRFLGGQFGYESNQREHLRRSGNLTSVGSIMAMACYED